MKDHIKSQIRVRRGLFPILLSINSAKEKPNWGATKKFWSQGTNIKSVKMNKN